MNIHSLLRQPVLTVAFHEQDARWTLGPAGEIAHAGSVALAPGMVDDGVIRDCAAVARMLREDAGFPRTRRVQAVAGLPAQRSIFRQIDVPALKGKQLDELMEREIRRELPMLADNAHVTWKVAPAGDDGASRAFIAGVARDVIDTHIAALRAAGLAPVSADLRIVAAARAAGLADAVIVYVEESELELGIFRGGVPSIVRYVPLAHTCGEPAWGDQIAQEVARTLKFYRDSRREDAAIASVPVCLVGAAARLVDAGDVSAAAGQDVVLGRIAQTIVGDELRFAGNIGLAMKDLAA